MGAYSLPTGLQHQESLSLVYCFFLNLSHQYPVEHGEETEIEGKFILCLRLPRVWYSHASPHLAFSNYLAEFLSFCVVFDVSFVPTSYLSLMDTVFP